MAGLTLDAFFEMWARQRVDVSPRCFDVGNHICRVGRRTRERRHSWGGSGSALNGKRGLAAAEKQQQQNGQQVIVSDLVHQYFISIRLIIGAPVRSVCGGESVSLCKVFPDRQLAKITSRARASGLS